MPKETESGLTISSSVGNYFDKSALYALGWTMENFAQTVIESPS